MQPFHDDYRGAHDISSFDQRQTHSSLTGNGEEKPMFRCVTEFIHGPKNVIPSAVWFERTKQRFDLIRERLACGAVYSAFEISAGFAKGEMNFPRIRRITQAGNRNGGKIKGGPQVFDCGDCVLCENGGKIFSESKFVEFVNSIRVRLSDKSVWCTLEKCLSPSLELGNIFLSPVDASSGITEMVSHSSIDSMKSNPKTSEEYDRFTSFMKRLVAVPHSEIKEKLDAEKRTKQRKKRAKTSPASRASNDRKG